MSQVKKRELKRKLFRKLTNARRDFKNKGIQARGENKFNNFKYITLEDIVNSAIDILADNDLCIHQKFYLNPPLVELVDLETGYVEHFGSRLTFEPDGKNTNQRLQGLGSTETYLRRYIYLQILDIVECDPDKNFGKPEKSKQKVIQNNQKQQSMPKKSKPSKPEPTKNDITTEQIKEILDKAYEKLTNAGIDFTIENADFTIKRLCNNQALYERCIETLQYKGGGVN